MKSFPEFVETLNYLGGNLFNASQQARREYCDLEGFFLQATFFMSEDTRVTQCFLTWLKRYGVLLSPCKIRRMVESGTTYRPDVLGAFVLYLEEFNQQKKHWDIVKPFAKRSKTKRLLFAELPAPRKSTNKNFLKFGIVAHPLVLDEPKYLQQPEFVLRNCPEIRYRVFGTGIPAADLLSYLEKMETKTFSLYEAANRTHQPRASIYRFYRMFENLGGQRFIVGQHR